MKERIVIDAPAQAELDYLRQQRGREFAAGMKRAYGIAAELCDSVGNGKPGGQEMAKWLATAFRDLAGSIK
jgi:hypothetical protein